MLAAAYQAWLAPLIERGRVRPTSMVVLNAIVTGPTHSIARRWLAGRLTTPLHAYVDELTEVGCDLKDYRLGLVDFIGRHEGHDVCLCWKLGEDTISYWHEMNAGYTGRQPVSVLRENV